MMNTYMITGADGYIGSALVKELTRSGSNRITAPVRNADKARKLLPPQTEIVRADITDTAALCRLCPDGCDYVIHCAAPTRSSYINTHPEETFRVITEGTAAVLEFAKKRNVSGMVNLSSMEVYGDIDCSDGHHVHEDECGYIDADSPRSSYPLGKRAAEELCRFYYTEYQLPVKNVRLAQTFGHGILPGESRIFARIAESVFNGRPIILHTDGTSMGNYCDIRDTVNGILTVLHKGKNGETYNIVNEQNTMSIKEMAELVIKELAHGRSEIIYDIPDNNIYGYAAHTGIRLSAEKIMSLGWRPEKSLVQMYRDILKDMEG